MYAKEVLSVSFQLDYTGEAGIFNTTIPV